MATGRSDPREKREWEKSGRSAQNRKLRPHFLASWTRIIKHRAHGPISQAMANRGGHSCARKIHIASFRDEISNNEVSRVTSSSLRKKTGGLTSFIFAMLRIAQRRSRSR